VPGLRSPGPAAPSSATATDAGFIAAVGCGSGAASERRGAGGTGGRGPPTSRGGAPPGAAPVAPQARAPEL